VPPVAGAAPDRVVVQGEARACRVEPAHHQKRSSANLGQGIT